MDASRRKVDSSLDLQRKLALKTLSRADEKASDNSKRGSMSISYLLRPNESARAQSVVTLNPSNFFNISDMIADITPGDLNRDLEQTHAAAPIDDISQSVQQILASSCVKDVQDSVLDLEDIKEQSIQNDVANTFLTPSFNFGADLSEEAKKQNFTGLSFKSVEGDAHERLLQDEADWQKDCGILPVQSNDKLNFTNFSGYLPSSGSNMKNFLEESVASIGDYFQGSSNIKSMINVKTPVKQKPVPLVDLDKISFNHIENNNRITPSIKIDDEEIITNKNRNSVASLSTIARALNEISVNDSPQTIYNAIMKKTNTTITHDEEIEQILRRSDESVIISGSIGVKANKENSDPNSRSASSSTLNSTADFIGLTENFAADLESTNIEDMVFQSNSRKNKSPIRMISQTSMKSGLENWIKPDEIILKNSDISKIKNIAVSDIVQNSKKEESIIMISDDSNKQDLNISIRASDVDFPVCCPMNYSLKLLSKSGSRLYIKVKFLKLVIGNKLVQHTNIEDYFKIEMLENSVFVEPQKEKLFTIRVWGFSAAPMNITLAIEGSDAIDETNKKLIEHTFKINFYKPSIIASFADNEQEIVKNINFGNLPSRSTETIGIMLTKSCSNSIPLTIKMRGGSKQKAFGIVTASGTNVVQYSVELQNKLLCKVRFTTCDETERRIKVHEEQLDIGLFVNDQFLVIKSIQLKGTEFYSNVLFNKDYYPLHLEYGSTGSLLLYNDGLIDLVYDIFIADDIESETPCNDDIFSVELPRITLRCGEELSLKVTLNKELLNTAKRYVVFKQTFNGPSLQWPIIGKSRSIQKYLKCFMSPSRIDKKVESGRTSPSINLKETLLSATSPTNLSVMSNFKVSNKVSPAKSTQSSFSSGSAIGNRLPIRAMKTHISWPSTKIGKTMSQDVTIKNISDHRIKIIINIMKSGFTLGYNNECSNSMTMILHGSEVRTFSVIFSPQRNGLYSTKLEFTDNRHATRLTLPLVGFGGYSEVAISGVFKLPNDKNFLSLGQFSSINAMSESIKLYNKGTVPAFAYVSCDSFRSNLLLSTSEISITPEIMIIQPNTFKIVNISFKPKKGCVNNYNTDVIELAALTIMTGDDGLRQRARKLYQSYPMHKGEKIWSKLLPLFVQLDDEPCYSEISYIKEPMSALYDIIAPLKINDISVTVENRTINNDSTILADETILFQSLCAETLNISDTAMESLTFEPSRIIFYLPSNVSDVVKLCNNYDTTQKINITAHTWFKIRPMSAVIAPKSHLEITVSYVGGHLQRSQSTSLQILTDNDVIKIPIEVNT